MSFRTSHRTRVAAGAVTALTLVAVGLPSASIASARDRDTTQDARRAIVGGTARNVILLLGDGMGDSEITMARNYQVGAKGRLALDSLPLTGAYTTYSVQKANPSLPDYVTDSAAAGTGWATGYKTYNGGISVTPDGKPKPTILELAKRAGFRTGDVTTAELQDATPAVLASHVVNRDCKGPVSTSKLCPSNAVENGGRGSISEQEVALRPDLLLGGGRRYFDETIAGGRDRGKTVWQVAGQRGYQRVTTAAELAAVSPRSKDPVLGSFASGNLDPEWTGPTPTAGNTPPSTCTVNSARTASQPRLAEMTSKALQVLDSRSKGARKGFFLQVEGASIDKQETVANPCGQIGETVAFDAAVAKALAYQRSHRNTLVVVTADHGHTGQIVEAGSTTTGVTATLVTRDGANMTISYATTPYPGGQQHTGTQVRVAAKGPQAASVLGVTDQTDLFSTFRRALGLR